MTPKPGKLVEMAREWQNEHRPPPLKCIYCGTPYTSGSMAGGVAWAMNACEKAPQKSHVYEITTGDAESFDRLEAVRLADFGERLIRECAEIADSMIGATRHEIADAILSHYELEKEPTP